VRFATECLGISNVPEGTPAHVAHHPRWKARVPRDNGSPYDFEDVRDHYVHELFGLDPVRLRTTEVERYWAVSRAVSGELMARTYSEWRRPASSCGGALVWFHRDLWEGAGWGIVAADGTPKSPYWYLKRAWAPLAVRVTDEGLDGLSLHVINERAVAFEGRVEIAMFHRSRLVGDSASIDVHAGPRCAFTLSVDAVVGHFTDSANSYRFGPPKQDVVVVRLVDRQGRVVSEDFHFPAGLDLPHARAAIRATATHGDGVIEVALESDAFLQSVAIDSPGYRPDDNHFHLAPDRTKRLVFRPLGETARAFSAYFAPLNAPGIQVRAEEQADAA
jgi:beta-mannosidase